MDFNERLRKREEARDCFLHAAELLTRPNLATVERTALVIAHATIGLRRLAEWDEDGEAKELVLDALSKVEGK